MSPVARTLEHLERTAQRGAAARKAAWPALAIVLLNALFVYRLFTIEYSRYMASIEGAYLAIARWMMAHPADLWWYPLWYGGIPFQNTYPPLLHEIVAAVATITQRSPALAYHAVTAMFYALAPAALYWLVLRLSGSRAASVIAALFYSLLAPSAFLMATVRHDMGSLLHDRRLQVLMLYGEGPHLAALALVPVAIVLLDAALESRTALRWSAAASAIAAVALTNWIGSFALALGALALLLTRTRRMPSDWRLWAHAAVLAGMAYALAVAWIPPSTIATIHNNAPRVGGIPQSALRHDALDIAGLIALAVLVKIVAALLRARPALQFFLIFSVLTATLGLISEWLHYDLIPQALRYHLEMDLALCGLAGIVAARILAALRPRRAVYVIALACIAVLATFQARHTFRYARTVIGQPIDITQTIEYREAHWLGRYLYGRRVFVPGTISFWLNAFSDNPQIAGGFDNGMSNPTIPAVTYFLLSGDGTNDPEYTRMWLEAYGIQAVGVEGPRTREYYRPLQKIARFDDYRVLWQEGDDSIRAVPLHSASLAHVIGAGDAPARRPVNGVDVAPLRPYVAALRNAAFSRASFNWTSQHSAVIHTVMRPGQELSVQVAWDRGWHASANGAPRPVRSDGIGQIVVDTACNGPCEVTLDYDGGYEMLAAMGVSILASLLLTLWCIAPGVLRVMRKLRSK